MKTLTKKQKAAVMAYAITFGYFDYFDCVDWKPHLHKYRYACAGDERVHYVSQSNSHLTSTSTLHLKTSKT